MPDIPVVYGKKIPEGFINDVNGWGSYSKEILDGNIGKLLSMDIDFGDKCELHCPHCFKNNNKNDFGDQTSNMSPEDMLEIVRQGKELGLKSVKFLGAGEPFEDGQFLAFLRDLKKLDIVPSIFTKGHVIGDDALVKKHYYQQYGISTGQELVKELVKVNASILLGFNSVDANIQNKMVGMPTEYRYTKKRNRALELLAEADLNTHNPTHLCLAVNPVTKDNYSHVLPIYKWARERNIYVIVCPTMISGSCASPSAWKKINPEPEQLIKLYLEIYKYNIEKGIQTLEKIRSEGISAYAGGHPCNQVACGMYVTWNGTVLRCPGDDTTVLGNVLETGGIKQGKLKEIWRSSQNFDRSGLFNCRCPPKDGNSIPKSLYTEVLERLVENGEK
jgi:MoaA/NifB/PqqE/SkfB family radical SAM enzyme